MERVFEIGNAPSLKIEVAAPARAVSSSGSLSLSPDQAKSFTLTLHWK
jgi:hypothetical protein